MVYQGDVPDYFLAGCSHFLTVITRLNISILMSVNEFKKCLYVDVVTFEYNQASCFPQIFDRHVISMS